MNKKDCTSGSCYVRKAKQDQKQNPFQ